MKDLIERCMANIRDNSAGNGAEGYDVKDPKNPSIIINFNLDNEEIDTYYSFLGYLWSQVDVNIPKTDRNSNFEEVINELCANQVFEDFHVIHIHILVNLTKCDLDELYKFVKDNFSGPTYKIILHEFLDYTNKADIEPTEDKLLTLMRNKGNIQYRFIYSNKLDNGGMWTGESAFKILRLAADVTAIMIIDTRYFDDGDTYTFSYNLLEKPAKKIIQFTVKRLLENLCNCPDVPELDQAISKKYSGIIKRESGCKSDTHLFNEDDFKYLPDNKGIYKEKSNIKKSIKTLERNYPVTAACFTAMIARKVKEVEKMQLEGVDFSKDLNDPLLSFFSIKGFLKGNQKKEELLEYLKRNLIYEKQIPDEGTYSKILTEYSNNAVKLQITAKIFEIFSKQCMKKTDHAFDIYNWITEYSKDPQLQINAINSEKNFIEHYGKLIDDYFKSNAKEIIAELDECKSKEELLVTGLQSVLFKMFNKIPIYFKSFEDEIDERVGNDTARRMLENICNPGIVNNNICINWTNLQFDLRREQTGSVLLLINPESKLIGLDIANNYQLWKLSRQDCVERIDFRILSLT